MIERFLRFVVLTAAYFFLVDGNDNNGRPAFAVDNVTGVLTVASFHNFEETPQVYDLVLQVRDYDFAIDFIVTAIMLNVNEPPLFETTPRSSVTLRGMSRSCSLRAIPFPACMGACFLRLSCAFHDAAVATCREYCGRQCCASHSVSG